MVSVRPGRLLAAGFGVAPSTVRHTEQPPLSRALQRAGSSLQRTIKEASRISSSLPSASRAPALAALALAALSIIAIAGEQNEGKRRSERRGAQTKRESHNLFCFFFVPCFQTKLSFTQPRPLSRSSLLPSKNNSPPTNLPRPVPRLCGSGLCPRRLAQEQKRQREPSLRAALPGDELDLLSARGQPRSKGEPSLGHCRRRLFLFFFGFALFDSDQRRTWRQHFQQQNGDRGG